MLRRKVLFICLGNSCRSIMAEALTRHLCGDRWAAASAGLAPLGWVAPETLEVLGEMGVDTAGLHSKGMEEVDLAEYHLLVNLAERSLARVLRTAAPERIIHRPVLDPFGESLAVYRRSRDAIIRLIEQELCRGTEPQSEKIPRENLRDD